MSTMEQKIQNDLVKAMKDHNENTVSALRSVKAAIQNEKTKGAYHELKDADIIKIIQKQIKQREESLEIYEKAGRTDLAEKEKAERLVLTEYVPKKMKKSEIEDYVEAIIKENNFASIKDMGKVMQQFSSKFAGRADGKLLSEIVKTKLNDLCE